MARGSRWFEKDQGPECCPRFSIFAGSRGRRQRDLCQRGCGPCHASTRFEKESGRADNDLDSLFKFQLDPDGFTRLGPFPTPEQEDQVVRPLVRRDKTTGRKRISFTPVRFNRFEGWSIEESWEFMTYIFHTYINTPQNTVSIKWEKGDVAVFNNHATIHTSTPWELYKGKERRFRLTFLNSKKMFEDD